jgi:predicted NBD/HSP70 family sugar kinase
MELFGIAITILAAILTYQAWNNGRWMKQTNKDTQNWTKQAHQDTIEILARIEQGQQEARKEMAEAIKYLADLIVSEGNKTRQALKS